ncbi:MAG TPA: hypothetical protein VK843_08200 [Planctomycetota bacterium]|nr:hypothetical protein [Planctomycetota bacterium]
MSVPVCLLAAGCWFAYKDGGRFARISASVLGAFMVCAFGFGVVRGLDNARASQEIGKELKVIRDGLAADTSDTDVGPEAAQRHMKRTDEAVARLQASDNTKTQSFARVIQSVTTVMRKPELRLIEALETVSSERFMDVERMLASDDFAWQRKAAQQYEIAAKGASASHAKLPGVVEAELQYTGIDKQGAEQFMLGFKGSWQLSGRAYEAHLETAKSYGALIDFIEKNRAGIQVLEDGSISIQEPEIEAAYDQLVERAVACDAKVQAAVDQLNKSSAKR